MRIPTSLRAATAAVALAGLAGALTACGPDQPASTTTAPTHLSTAATVTPPTSPSASASASASPSASGSAPATNPSANPDGAALMASLLPLPAGAHEWPEETGSQDLNAFVKLMFAPDAQQQELPLMTRRGFVVAATRGWQSQDGSQVHAYLVKFSAPTGAESFYDGTTNTWRAHTDKGTVFDDAADQATGRIVTKLDDLGNAGVILMAHRGDTAVYLHYFTAATPDQAGATALLHRQLDLLAHPAAPAGA